ncbi:hypothetical protein [Bdellovibrio bacteriovorus]|uniref:hypothetical protein n=1 Tax=Bdellovibrio bacteriovorus TaxID=959 RepID=UPI0035A7299F
MKRIFIFAFSLLFSINAAFAAVLGKSQDAAIFDSVERLQVPTGQFTKLGDKQYLIETGNANVLKNANFQDTVATNSWNPNTANVDSIGADSTYLFNGKQSLSIALKQGNFTDLDLISQTYTANWYALAGAYLISSVRIARHNLHSSVSLKWCLDEDSIQIQCIETNVAGAGFGLFSVGATAKTSITRTYRVYLRASYNLPSTFPGALNIGAASLYPSDQPLKTSITTRWASWTPTLTNLGTGATSNLEWRQDGPNIKIRGSIVCGTSPQAAQAGFTMPNGYLPKSGPSSANPAGSYFRTSTTSTHGGIVLFNNVSPSNTLGFSTSSVYGNESVVPVAYANGASVCVSSEPIMIAELSIPIAGWENAVSVVMPNDQRLPTQQRFTSGSGTYTRPVGVTYIKVRMVGGGAGGSGSGTTASGGNGGAGGNTTFGTSLLTANGGVATGPSGGVGGTATIAAPAFGTAIQGGRGQGANQSGSGLPPGGQGASSPFGGEGAGAFSGGVGNAAVANSGSGGGGAGAGNTAHSGAGGGAGGYIEAYIINPSATYAYSVGTGGTGGTAGTTGFAGGGGGSGYIEVTEYYGAENVPLFAGSVVYDPAVKANKANGENSIDWGSYNSTITAVANAISVTSPQTCQFLRIGSNVQVTCPFDSGCGAAGGAATALDFTLPTTGPNGILHAPRGVFGTSTAQEAGRVINNGNLARADYKCYTTSVATRVIQFMYTLNP